MNFKPFFLATALSTVGPWTVFAATDVPSGSAQVSAAAAYADGEIKKIDLEQGKVTLKHGTIENLGMPGMTMVFRADTAILVNFRPGDTVRFKANRVDGALRVTELVAR